MGYPRQARLGDFSTEIVDALTNLRTTAGDIQTGANQLAQKLQQAGNVAVRVSNQTTGAVAGAKVGAQTGGAFPVTNVLNQIPKPVLYGGVAALAYLFLRR